VTVIDVTTGAPVEGATVQSNLGDDQTTDAGGSVTFGGTIGPINLHVFDESYNPVSVMNIVQTEGVVPLEPMAGNVSIGGFTGRPDMANVSTTGNIDLGLAGSSLAGDLVNLDLTTLLGDGFVTEIESTFGNFAVPLPGGLVVAPHVPGVSGGKDRYQVLARDGLRFAWGMAGRVNLFDILDLVGSGGGSIAEIIAGLLPYFERFEHGLTPIDIDALPRIVDSDDYDGDGDTTELIADYDAFPELDLAPSVPQRLRTVVELPTTPLIGDVRPDIAIVLGGTTVESVGYVLLGLNASSADDSGSLPAVVLKMAPAHSGLSAGEYAVVALTFDPNEAGVGLDGIDLPRNISGRLHVSATIPQEVVFDGAFPDLPEDSSVDVATRTVTIADVGADLYRVRVEGADSTWTIFSSEPGSLTLPSTPGGLPDPFAMPTIVVEALFARGRTLDDLVSPEGVTIRRLDAAVEGFGRIVIDAQEQ